MPKTRTTHCTPHTSRVGTLLVGFAVGLVAFGAPAWGQVIHEDLKLLADDGAAEDLFGFSVAANDEVIVIGAAQGAGNATETGCVYVYDKVTGAQIAKLFADDGQAGDDFGHAVAVGDDVLVVGASDDSDNGSKSGSVYLFEVSTGVQIAKLLPDNGVAGDQFGVSVDIQDGIVVIGSHLDGTNGPDSGAVYLFSAVTGEQLHKLLPSDGAGGDQFGRSVAIDDGVVVVGAYVDDSFAGSAYLFDAATGDELDIMVADDRGQLDYFGYSVAIDGGIVAVGAFGDDNSGAQSGSAYLFRVSTGDQLMRLVPDDPEPDHHFGHAVAIDNGAVVVGAWIDDDNGIESGSAYRFDAATGEQLTKLLPSDGMTGARFGQPVAIENGAILVGAYQDDDNGADSGSAYVFDVVCEADLTGDGSVDTLDFLLFLGAFAAGNPIADWNTDGVINTLDFLAYLNDWSAGC